MLWYISLPPLLFATTTTLSFHEDHHQSVVENILFIRYFFFDSIYLVDVKFACTYFSREFLLLYLHISRSVYDLSPHPTTFGVYTSSCRFISPLLPSSSSYLFFNQWRRPHDINVECQNIITCWTGPVCYCPGFPSLHPHITRIYIRNSRYFAILSFPFFFRFAVRVVVVVIRCCVCCRRKRSESSS